MDASRSTFVITLRPRRESIQKIQQRIKAEYPDHFKISDYCYLVSSNEISRDIALRIGLKGKDRIEDSLGIVFRLNGAYSGYYYKSAWEWIKQAERELV